MRSTNLISSSFNSSLISSNNSSSAVISVLKDVMEGLGWQDMSADIYQAEAEHELANRKLATAVKYYLETNDTHSRGQLIKALSEKLTEIQSEYDHAIKQQKYYEAQAKIEAEQKSTNSSSYLSQWSHWVFDGIKTFFGSTTEQLIEKYQKIASNRSLEISASFDILNALQIGDEKSDGYVKIHSSENVSLSHFPPIFNISTLNSQTGLKMRTQAIQVFFSSISNVADSNGDGYNDIIIGNPSNYDFSLCYVLFGGPNIGILNVLNLTDLNGTDGFKIKSGNFYPNGAGWSVGGKGDINGDGIADFAIGAPQMNNVGAGYIIFGSTEFRSTLLSLDNLNGTNGIKFLGENIDWSGYSQCGAAVRIIDDINGDKYSEFVIGAPQDANQIPLDGRIYVIFGQSNLASIAEQGVIDLGKLNGTYGFKLNGESNTTSGYSIRGLGDINGDGSIYHI